MKVVQRLAALLYKLYGPLKFALPEICRRMIRGIKAIKNEIKKDAEQQ
ncbi:hypothetical protein NBRC111894_2780 [Sporolactobacillus inulinus]|uniref:Uncharacterized protein n=1 Tax=Sporolactobacillus inulinus TaxID=2078 RepID=A0A4Y1ZDN5_9BACL|nr:hypothetical protein NBRC111894_2780 [Sporolactobacillus inulinus]